MAPAAAAASRDKNEVAHRIGLLENRLDGVMVGFNATLSTNSAIRKEVDHLVQERAAFNDMIARLQKKEGIESRMRDLYKEQQ